MFDLLNKQWSLSMVKVHLQSVRVCVFVCVRILDGKNV